MKHSMMRVAVAATLGLSALAANAGQIGVNVGATLAAEYLTSTVAVTQPTITYQTASLINDGATVYAHVRFSAGDVGTLPGAIPAVADVKLFLNNVAYTFATVNSVTADADKLGYMVSLTANAGAGGIPAGLVINFTGATAKIGGLTAALSTGGSVTTTVGYTVTPGDFAGVSTWVEPPSTATLLTSSKVVSQVVKNSNAVLVGYYGTAESKQVDVTNSLTTFVGGSPAGAAILNAGVTKLVLTAGTTVKPAGGAPSSADFGGTVFTATGDFTAAAVAGVFLASDEACTASVAAGTLSSDKKTVTFASVLPAVAFANNYLCYTTNGTSAINYNVQYAIGAGVLAANANTVTSTQVGANTYLLGSNGASVIVPSFVPTTGALGSGYNTYLRVINTGNLASDIKVAAYNPTTGVVGTPAVLKTALAAGGSVVLSTDAISSALGLTSGTWYSLMVTGITSRLAAQPLLVNPQGIITNIGSVNGANNSAASN